MLLAIDVGNTEMKLGCFDGVHLVHKWRVVTEARRTADEYDVFISQLFANERLDAARIDAVVVSSVVPRLDHTLAEVCEKLFARTPVFLNPATQTLIPVRTDRPADTGADLVAAAIGARAGYGAPLIVACYGTASVFVAIDASGAFVGAAIAPGINISIEALVARTAKLPQVALDEPERAVGRNTVEALQSGLVYGFIGQTDAIVARMRAEMGVEARVIATGGLAGAIARRSATISAVDPDVNLVGLRLFYEQAYM